MMATEIKLPELGENLNKGDVVDVKVAPGDVVTAGQTLLEVEAEKSTVEVPSPFPGKIAKLFVKKGQSIDVGQVLFLIEESGAAAAVAPAPGAPAPAVDEEVAPKPAVSLAPTAPRASSPPASGAQAAKPASEPAEAGAAVAAGPATRRLARELGVDLSLVPGTGKNGRISEDDVKAYVQNLVSGSPARAGGGITAPPLPDFAKWGAIEKKPLEGIRKKTAEQMSLAWNLVAHVTHHDRADITDLEAFRKQQEAQGTRLTVTAFALKAVAIALQQFPQFNSSLDLSSGQLILKRYYHLGVAVDTDRGLLVPVIRDVDKKSVQDVGKEMTDLAERARQKKVSIEEMRGGTFTITNLGGIGGTAFTPIVNWPEVAILGLSRSRLEPVYRNGQLGPRLLLPLSLSYDHRVLDGADAARFVRRLVEMLENPFLMLLHA